MSADVALTGGRILCPDGVVRPGTVLVAGDRIIDGGETAREIDATGLTILPGLIDVHSHLTLGEAADAKARASLRVGVTTVRDVGGYRHADLQLRDAIARGEVAGPAMQCAGRFITRARTPGAELGVGVAAASELGPAARAELDAGADLVKVIGSGGVLGGADDVFFDEDELRRVVELGRPVAVHAHPAAAVKNAVRAGAQSIEHGSFLDDEAAATMVASDAFLVPTFAIYQHLARVSPDPAVAAASEQILSRKQASFRIALERGVRWGVGSDADMWADPSLLIDEAVYLVREIGLTPAEVIAAATAGNAQLLGIDDEVGSIRAGRLADLTLVAGDPLQDIEALRSVALTVARGVVHDWRDNQEVSRHA
ncbi:MAG TPA: amidohydrolase family protein [Gaiellaceae bacterium]